MVTYSDSDFEVIETPSPPERMADEGGLSTLVSNPEARPRLSAVEREAAERQRDRARREQGMQMLETDALRSDENSLIDLSKAGETLSGIWEAMPWYDRAAVSTSLVPIVGDIVGLGADAITLAKEPSWANLSWLGAGLIPWVPSGGVTRGLRQAMVQIPNYLKPFYSKMPGSEYVGIGEGGAKGLVNIAEARVSPKARGIFKEQGVSVADRDVASKAMNTYKDQQKLLKNASPEEAKIIRKNISQAMKKATGQFRQSVLMGHQYKDPSKFHKISQGLDEVGFGTFSTKEYNKIMDGVTGLSKQDFNSVFNEISKVWKVNPKKNYQMVVRRTNTQAAGNLDNFAYKRPIFGGSSLTDLKKNVFKGKKFKINKKFLETLKANKVGVINPEEVLKGRPAIVTGNVNSDAVELGGVNYMTAIKKDGTLVSFMSDEHDLKFMKLPKGDRMLSVSTPITIDILKKKGKPQRLSSTVKRSKETLLEAKRTKAKEVEETLSKYPGVDISLPTPKGVSKAQFYATQAVANMSPDHPDYSRIIEEYGLFAPVRAAKPLIREEDKKAGGSVIERNPYDYPPRAI